MDIQIDSTFLWIVNYPHLYSQLTNFCTILKTLQNPYPSIIYYKWDQKARNILQATCIYRPVCRVWQNLTRSRACKAVFRPLLLTYFLKNSHVHLPYSADWYTEYHNKSKSPTICSYWLISLIHFVKCINNLYFNHSL